MHRSTDVRGDTPGVAWLIVNYRGYGASEGLAVAGFARRGRARGYDYASRFPDRPKRIFVFGRSLGSGVAVQLRAHRPCAG
jgi:hypothetical protein